MLKIFAILITILLIKNTELYSQEYWLTQPALTSGNLKSVFFTDSLNGWIGGDSGIILHTTNKGQNWSFQNSGVSYEVISLYFLNERLGFALSWEVDNTPPAYFGTRILSTSNGGNTWNNYLFQDTNLFLNTIFFLDSLNGFIGGTGGKLYYTNNSGSNWTEGVIDSGFAFGFPVKKIEFYNAQTGWAVGGGFDIAGVIWKSTNGGHSWKTKIVGPEPLNDLHIFDSLNLISVGGDYEYGPSNVKTSTGGAEWSYHELGIFGISNSIAYRTETEAWSALGIIDSFLISTDRGDNWNLVKTPGGALISDIIFTDYRNGWAVGFNGVILKYNSGLISVKSEFNNLPESANLFQNYPNPFNPMTRIDYYLQNTNFVSLRVYDMLGNEIAELVNERQKEGSYTLEWNAGKYPSGIYFYSLYLNGKIINTKKMVLIK